ncbi:hypothetical protein BJG93_33065 (plasmid) [Paraburkholderia sprentiae WSM5005]|uniref:Uncharacterized protein n=1 Tax=Paraburkholderia sprentiae WSM5005 TaxID=754502 RepID=A0A1I9YW41_9BURK|nr:hypothetical protein [Paraburkholderia sprentiae]APA90422.1 hypothetical protein BJG93_33065 [Paraburkholderia sprentiae WSM5005]
MDRLSVCYTNFMALPFFLRRVVIFIASVALWVFGAWLAHMHVNMDLCVVVLLTGAGGAVWASEVWRLWKVFAIVTVVCLAILKS